MEKIAAIFMIVLLIVFIILFITISIQEYIKTKKNYKKEILESINILNEMIEDNTRILKDYEENYKHSKTEVDKSLNKGMIDLYKKQIKSLQYGVYALKQLED